jgi:peroxiredoxin
MSVTRSVRPDHASAPMVSTEIPPVPLTIEGYSVLHQMMRFRWSAWRPLRASVKKEIAQEASGVLAKMEQNASGQSGLFSLLGHKGDLMFVHFRQSFEELNQVEMQLANLRLSDFLETTTSYLSVIELGLYESTIKVYNELAERGVEAHSEEWNRAIKDTLARQKEAMRPRLFPDLPKHRYLCFYPMDRRRGEEKNWYTVPIEERARQMNEHGLVFKKLIYEMRFDEVSAVYALFGTFYVGLRCSWCELGKLLSGQAPKG